MRGKMLLLTAVILAMVLFIWAVIADTSINHPTYTSSFPYILFSVDVLLIMIGWIGTLIRQALRKQWFWFFGMLVPVIGFAFVLLPDAFITAIVVPLIYSLVRPKPSHFPLQEPIQYGV